MARAYTSRIVALTIRMPEKWVDNLLGHSDLPGVSAGRQGLARQISDDGLLAIEIVRQLITDLGVSAARAVQLASEALSSRSAGSASMVVGAGLTLTIPVAAVEARLRRQVIDAVESAAPIRRGRPPRVKRASDS